MKLTRRSTIIGMTALGALQQIRVAHAQTVETPAVRIRRDIDSMAATDDDLLAFKEGIKIMKADTGPLSWERQRIIHANWDEQHGGWRFLPWHRIQLYAFEQIVAKVTGHDNFALPYWDWQKSRTLPAELFDPNSELFVAGRRADANTDISKERWDYSNQFADLARDGFSTFVGGMNASGRVENLGHNLVHVIVGGPFGDVATATTDPLFFLHHANCDRVWSTWQNSTDRIYPSDFVSEQFNVFQGPDGNLPAMFAGDVIDTDTLGYQYDSDYPFSIFNVSVTPPPGKTVRQKVASTDRYVEAKKTAKTETMELDVPTEILNLIRADRNNEVTFEGRGVVRFGLDNLRERVMRVVASAPDGWRDGRGPLAPVTVLASAAFFHGPGTGDHAAHSGHNDLGATFSFGQNLVDLIYSSKGPVKLSSSTISAFVNGTGPEPEATGLSIAVRATENVWR